MSSLMETLSLDGEGDVATSKSIAGGTSVRAGTTFSGRRENKALTKKDGISVVFDTIAKSIPFVAESTSSEEPFASITVEVEGTLAQSVMKFVARIEEPKSVTVVLVVGFMCTFLEESVELIDLTVLDTVPSIAVVVIDESTLEDVDSLDVTAPPSCILLPLVLVVGFLVVNLIGGKYPFDGGRYVDGRNRTFFVVFIGG